MFKRSIMGVFAVFMAVGASWMVVTPAANATDCPSGHSCFWRDTGYVTDGITSRRIKFEFYIPNFGNWVYPNTNSSGANSASSVSNEGNFERSYWYTGTSCSTFAFSLGVNRGDGDLTNSTGEVETSAYNNQLESGAFDSSRGSC
jgi:hypothetical protein